MWLRVAHLWTTVAKADAKELRWLWDFLSYEDEKKERAMGQGTVRLLSRRHRRFPTGLVPLVERHARKAGFEVKRIDTRARPHPLTWQEHVAQADLDWLKVRRVNDRPFQYEAITSALKSGRGIIRAPTGSGKGEMVVGLCKALPIKWLFVVHRGHLVEDIAERWKQRGDGSGSAWLGKGNWKLGERVSFCTFQSLHHSLKDPACQAALQQVEGVIIDECHTLAAESFMQVCEAIAHAFYKIGLSGTPLERSDGRSLMAIAQTGPVVYNVTPRELMNAGYVAEATVHITRITQKPGPSVRATWASVRKHLIAESKRRNAAVLRDAINCAKPAMVFVDLLSHGRILKDALSGAGLAVDFVWGEAGAYQRKSFVDQLEKNDLEILIANGVFREGVDIPNLRSVVYAAAGKSAIGVIQAVGRGSRVTADKRRFDIYDYRDRGQRWIAQHADTRVRIYQRYGYSVVENNVPFDEYEEQLDIACTQKALEKLARL